MMSEREKEIKQTRMTELALRARDKLTKSDREELDALSDSLKHYRAVHDAMPWTTGPATRTDVVPEIQGTPNETLVPGQSMAEWVRRAAQNGVTTQRDGNKPERVTYHAPEFLNEYWGQRIGIAKAGAALRALGEDTSGSGLAITPQSWTATFVDFLYAQTVLGRAGISRVPMATELVNVPVLVAPVQPAWIAENSTVGIDANPAFSSLTFNAQGGFKDITLYSVELAQDAYIQGGLPGMLAQSAARNYALAVDVAGLQGISGNSGNPGLVNETGAVSRQYTADGGTGIAPADTTEFSKVNEIIANKNVDLSMPAERGAILSNPSVYGTLKRLNAGTYAHFWAMPEDVANLPWYRSANANVFPVTETDAGALTGGALSSFYMGPWARMIMGLHLDLSSRVLTERYIDYGQFGLWSNTRFSIRTSHPETFVRTRGIITT